jgi:hypothetical protein
LDVSQERSLARDADSLETNPLASLAEFLSEEASQAQVRSRSIKRRMTVVFPQPGWPVSSRCLLALVGMEMVPMLYAALALYWICTGLCRLYCDYLLVFAMAFNDLQ